VPAYNLGELPKADLLHEQYRKSKIALRLKPEKTEIKGLCQRFATLNGDFPAQCAFPVARSNDRMYNHAV